MEQRDRARVGGPGRRRQTRIALAVLLALGSSLASSTLVSAGVPAESKVSSPDGQNLDKFGQAVATDGDVTVIGAPGHEQDRGAVYVYGRCGRNWVYQAKLTAPGGEASDQFGYSVAIDGETIVVGAPGHGASYVFTRKTIGWVRQATLTADDSGPDGRFGWSVSVANDTAVVGARSDGAAYVFTRTGDEWAQQQKLAPSDGHEDDGFGSSVAVDEDTAVVGAALRDGADAASGAAYVFTRGGDAWSEEAKLTASDATSGSVLGFSVAVHGDTALVGAHFADGVASRSGAAYVFTRNGDRWSTQAKLTAADGATDAVFGFSVALEGDTAIVGSHLAEPAGPRSGAAYVFSRIGDDDWGQKRKLTPSSGAALAQYGVAVALAGESVVVGASLAGADGPRAGCAYTYVLDAVRLEVADRLRPQLFGNAVATHGDTVVVGDRYEGVSHPSARDGAAHVYVRSPGGGWLEQARLTASDTYREILFGGSVAIDDDTVVVGATGGLPPNLLVHRTAYVFTRDGDGDWTEEQRLEPTGAFQRDNFGGNVAVDGDTVLVSASADGLVGIGSGAVYVFTRGAGGGWTLRQRVAALDGALGDNFGDGLDISGDTAVIGASYRDDDGDASGAAYVFTRDAGGEWTQQQRLNASDADSGALFGAEVAIDDDTIVVGARGSASAYVFARGIDGVWAERQRLTPSDGRDAFGDSVSVHGAALVIGAAQSDEGSAYVFTRSGGTWTEQRTLSGADGEERLFGVSVGVHGDTIVVGAQGSDVAYTYSLAGPPSGLCIASPWLPVAVPGRPYAATLPAYGGVPPFAWGTPGGALPSGLELNAATGELHGAPALADPATFTIACVDATGTEVRQEITLDAAPIMNLTRRRSAANLPLGRLNARSPVTRALELVAGTRVTATARFRRKRPAPVSVVVLDAEGNPLDGSLRIRRRDVRLAGVRVPRTGRYFVRVIPRAPLTGRVRLDVTVVAPRAELGQVPELADDEPVEVEFATLARARVRFTVQGPKGSDAVPTILSVKDENGNELLVPRDLRHLAKAAVLRMRRRAPGGTLTVTLGTRDGTSGRVRWRAQIREPRRYSHPQPDLPAGGLGQRESRN